MSDWFRGKADSESLGVPFAQEVAANADSVQKKYEKVGTAIELGGQDAKMIFFKESETDHMRSVSDMRMNGSCAGGTGAFIDEIASVLKVPVEEFNALAAKVSMCMTFPVVAAYMQRRIFSRF